MTEHLVSVENLTRTFDVSRPWLNRVLAGEGRLQLKAVCDVSFTIKRGETFGLVGESGCGKSTVARLIVGLMRPTAGRVIFNGHGVGSTQWKGQRHRLQMIFQDPYASLNPRWRIGWIIAEPIRTFKLLNSRRDIDDRVRELLELVGLAAGDSEKYPHEFSGGQRQRIAIARALASEPDFLVCDEPTSALDVSVQAQVLNLMRKLQDELGLTYLLISHDLAVVKHMSSQVGVMYLGRIVETAPKLDLFEAPQHPYTQLLLDAIPTIDRAKEADSRTAIGGEVPSPIDPPPGCAFHPRCPIKFEPCDNVSPKLQGAGLAQAACHAVSSPANSVYTQTRIG